MKVQIDNKDLHRLLLFSMRYSMGRKSYAPSIVIEALKEHCRDLTRTDLRSIINALEETIHQAELTDTLLGMESDHQDWKECLTFLREYSLEVI